MAKKKAIQPMPFDTGDWLRCPEVKILAPDVRGLWFDLLCYLWESVDRGVMVKPNHEPYSREDIVRMIGYDCNNSGNWLDILIENDVCSIRESDGAIYSRRMVRDYDISQKRSLAGKKGGDITKTKHLVSIDKKDAVEVVPPAPPLDSQEQERLDKSKKFKYAEFVQLTRDEYQKLSTDHGEDGAKRMIQILDNYKGAMGKRYKSDYRAILNWVIDRYNEELKKGNGKINSGQTTGNTGETGKQHTYRETL